MTSQEENQKNNNIKSKLDDLKAQLAQPVVEPDIKTEYTNNQPNALTERQLRFIDEYLVDLHGTNAAIRAGYSAESAAVQSTKNLAKRNIQLELQKRKERLMIENGIKIEYVLQKLFDVINRAENNIDGPDDDRLLKALDMINKMGGFYTQTNVNVNIEMPPLFPDIII